MSQTIIFNPDYILRDDVDRIIIFTKKTARHESSAKWLGVIHPVQARILCNFTSKLSYEDNCEAIAQQTHYPVESIKSLIAPYIENKTPIYTQYGDNKIILPKNILIKVDNSELEDISYDFNGSELTCDKFNMQADRLHKGPLSILFMMTNKCVTNCKYCYADKNKPYKPLSTAAIIDLIDNAKRLKVQDFDIIGGEIFCRKDWNIILKELVEKGMVPEYISTKVPINRHIVRLLQSTGYNNVIQLSLDSTSDETLKKMTGSSIGYFNRVIKGLRLLEENNYKIQVNTILSNANSTKEQISALYKIIKDIHNLEYWEIRVPQATLYTPESFNEIKASRLELESLIAWIKVNILPDAEIPIRISDEPLHEIYQNEGYDIDTFGGGKCEMLYKSCFILPDGKVTICEQLYWHPHFIIGDLTQNTLEEIWSSPRIHELLSISRDSLQKSSTCRRCAAFEKCNAAKRKCWVRTMKAYGFENWDYPDPYCKYAPEFNHDMIYKQ